MALPAHPTPQSRPPPTDNPSNPCPIAQIAQKISQIDFRYQLPRKYTSATHPSASLSDCFCGSFVVFSCPIRKNPPYPFAMFSQSEFFMNLGGPLPALPFANKNPETQESYLAPLPGTPGTSSKHSKPWVPRLGIPLQLAPEILQDQGRSQGGKHAPAPKEWDKMWSKEDLVWKTVIMNWTWDQFKSMVIRVFGQGRDHFSTHINNVNKAGKLTWMCIIPNHQTYGKNSKYSVSSNSKFQRFMGAVLDNPTSQVIICVSMADPSMVAKKLEREKAKNKSLALNYGNKEERRLLALTKT
ncbi:hypothetical protein PCANC_22554 [Puccinia coronata f. sp. avenae]|uniref:Uncharacterized protein n=1 Tax=Puccinia coronata f. sp. avenae TaxID=200324 RepID=A0A2N5SBY0_9BASI|nr:hypothetical protein PCANC_22554 [Puccinia coronata f. sp. avenae]